MRALFPFKIFRVADASMEPTLSSGDYIVASLWASSFSKGDIVIAENQGRHRFIVKRISRKAGNMYFLLGDNRRFSTDSRAFGMVPRSRIVGKMLLRI